MLCRIFANRWRDFFPRGEHNLAGFPIYLVLRVRSGRFRFDAFDALPGHFLHLEHALRMRC